MNRLFRLLFQLVVTVVVLFLLTAAWVILDGITDRMLDKADVGLVYCQTDPMRDVAEQPLLDRVVKLFNDNDFPGIIVSGPGPGGEDAPAGMVKYLVSKGVPAGVIQVDDAGAMGGLQEGVYRAVTMMRADHFDSVLVVGEYYQLTRIKVILFYEGVTEVQKAHVGQLQEADLWNIGREVFALYDYVGRKYILPGAEKIRQQIMGLFDKTKADMEEVKKKVDNKDTDALPK